MAQDGNWTAREDGSHPAPALTKEASPDDRIHTTVHPMEPSLVDSVLERAAFNGKL